VLCPGDDERAPQSHGSCQARVISPAAPPPYHHHIANGWPERFVEIERRSHAAPEELYLAQRLDALLIAIKAFVEGDEDGVR